MSNIFEIDGEIEDNMDDNGENKKSSDNEHKDDKEQPESSLPIEDSHDEDGASIVPDNEPTVDSAEPESVEDNHWYDKYIDDEEGDGNSTVNNANEEVEIPESSEESGLASEEVDEDELQKAEDVTQEEIDEVLAELDQQEKEFAAETEEEDYYQNEEAEVKEEQEEIEESFDQIFPKGNGTPTSMGTWIFMVLFLITLSLLAYYQFYDGHSFKMTFEHRSEAGLSKIDSISAKYETQIAEITNQQSIIADLRTKVQELHKLNLELAEDTASSTGLLNNDGTPSTSSIDLNNGTYYQVQVIALQAYSPDFGKSDFSFYVDKENGYSKMLIGAFSNETAVKELYQKVRRSGFDDAFIVKKVNGKRVEYNPFD